MKYLITSFIVIFSFCSVKSQVQLSTTYGKSHIGWNFRVGGEIFPVKNFSLGVGARIIHLNNIESYDSNVYLNKFYPVNSKEKIGLFLSFNYYPLDVKNIIQPFLSYDFAYSRAHIRWEKFFEIYDNNNPTGIYEKRIVFFNPLNAFEHYLSFGLDVKLIKGITMTQKIGVGITHFSGYDYSQQNVLAAVVSEDKWEFSYFFFNIGLKYDFRNIIVAQKEKHLTKAKINTEFCSGF